MGFLRAFQSATPTDADNARKKTCCNNIKEKITGICGVTDFIENEDSIVFSGNLQEPNLLLTLSIMKTGGKHYLYADINDEDSWQEWDYNNQEDFENAIVEYIAPLINRTIKTVTEKKKHKHIKISRYYLNDDNQWILIDEEIISNKLIRLFIAKDKTEEQIQSHKL